MSLAPVHFPEHIFTSTMTDHRGRVPDFNVFIVLLTAIFFFTVLAWFNFALAFYGTITTTDPDHQDETMSTLGFAVVWTLIAIAIYYFMDSYSVLSIGSSQDDHPLLRGEGKAAIDPGSIGSSEYLGQIDMSSV